MYNDRRRCSFCDKSAKDVQILVAGLPESQVSICNECVMLCLAIFATTDVPMRLEVCAAAFTEPEEKAKLIAFLAGLIIALSQNPAKPS